MGFRVCSSQRVHARRGRLIAEPLYPRQCVTGAPSLSSEIQMKFLSYLFELFFGSKHRTDNDELQTPPG